MTLEAPQDGWVRDPMTEQLRTRYLDLMKSVLTRYDFAESWQRYEPKRGSWRHWVFRRAQPFLQHRDLQVLKKFSYDAELRDDGRDWPPEAETMVGLVRLQNLQDCVREVLQDRVPGDLIETGVWRGGACIFMRALLAAYGVTDRRVWVADSFQGLPRPRPERQDDVADALWTEDFLAVSQQEVEANFARYGLLDHQVRFLPGWFADTLPDAPVQRLAVIRLDGDMYDSTMVALESLYPRLSRGGFVIVDDYYAVHGCREAVDEFRRVNRITEELQPVDQACCFWRRSG